MDQTSVAVTGQEHWAKQGGVKLFRWEKRAAEFRKIDCGQGRTVDCSLYS